MTIQEDNEEHSLAYTKCSINVQKNKVGPLSMSCLLTFHGPKQVMQRAFSTQSGRKRTLDRKRSTQIILRQGVKIGNSNPIYQEVPGADTGWGSGTVNRHMAQTYDIINSNNKKVIIPAICGSPPTVGGAVLRK